MKNPITSIKNKMQTHRFYRELNKFDKTFSDYESLNMELYNYYDTAMFEDMNKRYLAGRSKLLGQKYLDLSPSEMLAAGYTREEMAMHGIGRIIDSNDTNHAWCHETGLSEKVAKFFENPVRKFADKHKGPFGAWQKFADCVSKKAHGGRLPLTADSAAILKITCDKNYYNKMREPGLTGEQKAELEFNYQNTMRNLIELAERDGVSQQSINSALCRKIQKQSRIDIDMQILYPDCGTNRDILNTKPSKPKSVREIMDDYAERATALESRIPSGRAYENRHKNPTYKRLNEAACKAAAIDNPDATAKEITYMFDRAKIQIGNAHLEKTVTNPRLMYVPPADYELATPKIENFDRSVQAMLSGGVAAFRAYNETHGVDSDEAKYMFRKMSDLGLVGISENDTIEVKINADAWEKNKEELLRFAFLTKQTPQSESVEDLSFDDIMLAADNEIDKAQRAAELSEVLSDDDKFKVVALESAIELGGEISEEEMRRSFEALTTREEVLAKLDSLDPGRLDIHQSVILTKMAYDAGFDDYKPTIPFVSTATKCGSDANEPMTQNQEKSLKGDKYGNHSAEIVDSLKTKGEAHDKIREYIDSQGEIVNEYHNKFLEYANINGLDFTQKEDRVTAENAVLGEKGSAERVVYETALAKKCEFEKADAVSRTRGNSDLSLTELYERSKDLSVKAFVEEASKVAEPSAAPTVAEPRSAPTVAELRSAPTIAEPRVAPTVTESRSASAGLFGKTPEQIAAELSDSKISKNKSMADSILSEVKDEISKGKVGVAESKNAIIQEVAESVIACETSSENVKNEQADEIAPTTASELLSINAVIAPKQKSESLNPYTSILAGASQSFTGKEFKRPNSQSDYDMMY